MLLKNVERLSDFLTKIDPKSFYSVTATNHEFSIQGYFSEAAANDLLKQGFRYDGLRISADGSNYMDYCKRSSNGERARAILTGDQPKPFYERAAFETLKGKTFAQVDVSEFADRTFDHMVVADPKANLDLLSTFKIEAAEDCDLAHVEEMLIRAVIDAAQILWPQDGRRFTFAKTSPFDESGVWVLTSFPEGDINGI